MIEQLQKNETTPTEFHFKPRNKNFLGRHLVLPVTSASSGQPEFCLKPFPDNPAVEYGLSGLMQRLVGVGYCVETQIARLSGLKQSDFAVQISSYMGNRSLSKPGTWEPELCNKISFSSFFAHFIRVLIATPKSDGPSGYFLSEDKPDGTVDLLRINLDRSFFKTITKNKVPTKSGFLNFRVTENFKNNETPILQLKSILLCFSKMNTEIKLDDPVVTHFLTIRSDDVLKAWIEDLLKEHENYKTLFEEDELFKAHYPEGLGNLESLLGKVESENMQHSGHMLQFSLLTVPFSGHLIYILDKYINALQTILRDAKKNHENLTFSDLVQKLHPKLPKEAGLYEDYYQEVLECKSVAQIAAKYSKIRPKLDERAQSLFNTTFDKIPENCLSLARYLAVVSANDEGPNENISGSLEKSITPAAKEEASLTQAEALAIRHNTHPTMGLKSAEFALENIMIKKGQTIINALFYKQPNVIAPGKVNAEIIDFLKISANYRKILIDQVLEKSKSKPVGPVVVVNHAQSASIHLGAQEYEYLLQMMVGIGYEDFSFFAEYLTDDLLIAILKTDGIGKSITTLDLTGCKKLTWKLISKLESLTPGLQQLVLRRTNITSTFGRSSGMSDYSLPFLKPFLPSFPELTKLDVSENAMLTDIEINAPKLKYLYATGCEKLNSLVVVGVEDYIYAVAKLEGTLIAKNAPEKQMLHLSDAEVFSIFTTNIYRKLLRLTKENNGEQALELGSQKLTCQHLAIIATVLCHPNCQISRLDLSNNAIDENGAQILKKALLAQSDYNARPHLITDLDITGNELGPYIKKVLHNIIELNKDLEKVQNVSDLGCHLDIAFLSSGMAKSLIKKLTYNASEPLRKLLSITSIHVAKTNNLELRERLYDLVTVNAVLWDISQATDPITEINICVKRLDRTLLKRIVESLEGNIHCKKARVNITCHELEEYGKYLSKYLNKPDLPIKLSINQFEKNSPYIQPEMGSDKAEIITQLKTAFIDVYANKDEICLEVYALGLSKNHDRFNEINTLIEMLFNDPADQQYHNRFMHFLSYKFGLSLFQEWLSKVDDKETLSISIKKWITAGDPSQRDQLPPLHRVALFDDVNCFLLFKELGADIYFEYKKNTALEYAIKQSKGHVFTQYVEHCYQKTIDEHLANLQSLTSSQSRAVVPIPYTWLSGLLGRNSTVTSKQTYGIFEDTALDIIKATGKTGFGAQELSALFQAGQFGAFLYLDHLRLLNTKCLEPTCME